MRLIKFVPMVLLVSYSVAVVGIELRTSQDHVRHYFTDIYGPVHFYAVNTTLSTFLLWSCAMIFAVGLLGLEAIAGHHYELYGEETLTFVSLATAEEILEMTGIAIFIYTLLLYIELECKDLAVTFTFSRREPTSR